jgi:hemoglobin
LEDLLTLFEKYGGTAVISAIVADFYERVLESDRVAHYFEGVDMVSLLDHQTTFLSVVLDGPQVYQGRNMLNAHAKLGITMEDFNEVAEILQDTLEDNGVVSEDVVTIMDSVAKLAAVMVSPAERK